MLLHYLVCLFNGLVCLHYFCAGCIPFFPTYYHIGDLVNSYCGLQTVLGAVVIATHLLFIRFLVVLDFFGFFHCVQYIEGF